MHDFTGLVVHFHLFFGVAVGGEYVNVRDEVVGELVGKFLDGYGAVVEYVFVLFLEFRHGHGSCSGCCLIGGYMYACDV